MSWLKYRLLVISLVVSSVCALIPTPLRAAALSQVSSLAGAAQADGQGIVGTGSVGYSLVCEDSTSSRVSCNAEDARPFQHPNDPARGDLMETWTRNSDGSYTYAYYWNRSAEFRDFQTFADRVKQIEIRSLGIGVAFFFVSSLSMLGCSSFYTGSGALVCVVGAVLAIIPAVIFFYYIDDREHEIKNAKLQQNLHPGEKIPETLLNR